MRKAETAERLLHTPRFTVERRQTRLPGGGLASRDIIIHPGAVTILPVLDDGSIVMIRNQRIAVGQVLLELPAGTLESGEDPAGCAARELEEEAGYRPRRLEPLCEFFTSPGILSERMYAFVATGLEPVGQNLDPTEEIEVDIRPLDNIRQLLLEGRISDGKTIAVLGTYLLRLEAGLRPPGPRGV